MFGGTQNLEALFHNVDWVRSPLGPDSQFIAAPKWDAYGHSIGAFVKPLVTAGVDQVAIVSLSDAHTIPEAGVERPILIYGGPLPEGIRPFSQLHLSAPCMTAPVRPQSLPRQ